MNIEIAKNTSDSALDSPQGMLVGLFIEKALLAHAGAAKGLIALIMCICNFDTFLASDAADH